MVVVDDGGSEPSVLSIPNLLLEATQSPNNQNKPRTTIVAGPVRAVKGKAGIDRIREVKGSADFRSVNRNSYKKCSRKNYKSKKGEQFD